MSSTIWVSVYPGTIGGLSHLSLASLSSVVRCFLASSFCLIQSFLLFSSLFFCDGLFFFLFLFTSMEIEKEKLDLFISWHILTEIFLLLTMLKQASTNIFTCFEILLYVFMVLLLDH